MISIFIPNLRLTNPLNSRRHWRHDAAKRKYERYVTGLYLVASLRNGTFFPIPPLVVTVTRIGPRTLDSDNVQAAGKSVRDAIADFYVVDDGGDAIEWVYRQERGAPKTYAVRITIERREESAA